MWREKYCDGKKWPAFRFDDGGDRCDYRDFGFSGKRNINGQTKRNKRNKDLNFDQYDNCDYFINALGHIYEDLATIFRLKT